MTKTNTKEECAHNHTKEEITFYGCETGLSPCGMKTNTKDSFDKKGVEERFDKEFPSVWKPDPEGGDWSRDIVSIKDEIKSFIIKELADQKKKMLGALPREKPMTPARDGEYMEGKVDGFNDCLAECKRVIENL